MTFSYSGDPSTSSRDYVRFLIGDVNASVALFSNEEINAILAKTPRVYTAAVALIDVAVARYAFTPDRTIDGLSVRWSTIVANLKELRNNLLEAAQAEEMGSTGASIYVGGLSEFDRDVDRLNPELSQPAFRRNQFQNRDNPP